MISIKERKFTRKIFSKDIVWLMNLFKSNGHEIYVVGGCVRDIFVGVMPHDIDFCTNATPEQMIDVFKDNNIQYFETGIKFGTISAIINGKTIEITTYRSDSNCSGRFCHVEFVSNIYQDLARRDYTINAIAYDYIDDVIVDPFHGIEDIENRKLRTVGNAKKRFEEDYLRILRGLRLCYKYNLTMPIELYEVMKTLIEQGCLKNISAERIQDELLKIFSVEHIEELNTLEPVLFYLFPELGKQKNYDQHNIYHCYDLWTHTCKTVCLIEETAKLFDTVDIAKIRLAALLHDVGKPNAQVEDEQDPNRWHYYKHEEVSAELSKEYLKNLKFSNKDIEYITTIIRYHGCAYNGKSKKSVRKLIKKVGEKYIDAYFALTIADKKTHNMERATELYLNAIHGLVTYTNMKDEDCVLVTSSRLAVDGNDIMKVLNIGPSKKVGEALNLLKEAVDNEEVENIKSELIEYLKKHLD